MTKAETAAVESDPPQEAAPTLAEPPVRLQLMIDVGDVPWETFQALDVGSPLRLGLSANTIIAEVQVDGYPFAQAELVALTDGLGLRITAIGDGG